MLDPNKAREALKDILAQDEYQVYLQENKNIFTIWWEKAKDWLAQQLEALFPSSETAGGVATFILILLVVIIVILMGVVLFFVIRNILKNRRVKQHQPMQVRNEIDWSIQMHIEAAQKHERTAHYPLATRHLFLALLLTFHEKKWLTAKVWKTNWDYYEELRKISKESAEQFYNLAILFDEVAYGERHVEKSEYSSFKNTVMQWIEELKIAAIERGS